MKKNIIFFISIFLNISNLIMAQPMSEANFLSFANYWEQKGNLTSAVYFYEELFKINPNQPLFIYEKYAQLSQQIHSYKESEKYYRKICTSDSAFFYSRCLFQWAMTLKNLSKYEEALLVLQKYQTSEDTISVYRQRLPIEIKFLSEIVQHLDTNKKIEIERFSDKVNSPYSEYNSVEDNEVGIYFSSLRPLTDNSSNILEDYFVSLIYLSPYSANGLNEARPIDKNINNTKYHINGFCFNEEKNKLYFSRCAVDGKKQYWQIFVSTLDDNGKWHKPEVLPKQINKEQSSNMFPYLVEDEEYDILYFVSDRSEGFGGLDIWYCLIFADGSYSEAVNLGSNVNTAGNEITPFYNKNLSRLYFSSDFHGGFGGQDIFFVDGNLSAWEMPKNMGLPINSSANDSYFSCDAFGKNGFFSSNRVGSYHNGTESCCNDIYSFSILSDTIRYFSDTIKIPTQKEIAKIINQILPITLYFHNDEPNPKSMAQTTEEDYAHTLKKYINLKDLYKTEYAKGLKGNQKTKAENEIELFFKEQVVFGLQLIDSIKQWLLFDLKNGFDVTLTIMGFASPLFTDEYNTNLSMRRIVSFENYIAKDTTFAPYLDASKTGNKLKFIAEPKGKNLAEKYVSNNPNDKRNSVYSIAAARERRIQVFRYERSEKPIIQKQQPTLILGSKKIEIQQQKKIDRYRYFVEIRNVGNSSLFIDSIYCSSEKINCKIEKNMIEYNETTYLSIEFNGKFNAFVEENLPVRLYYNDMIEEINIITQPLPKQ